MPLCPAAQDRNRKPCAEDQPRTRFWLWNRQARSLPVGRSFPPDGVDSREDAEQNDMDYDNGGTDRCREQNGEQKP